MCIRPWPHFLKFISTVGIVNKLCNEKYVDIFSWHIDIILSLRLQCAVPTSNIKADPKNLILCMLFVSSESGRGQLLKMLRLIWVCLENRMCLPRVSSNDVLYARRSEADPSVFVLLVSPTLVYSKYTCKEILSFVWSDLLSAFKIGVFFLCSFLVCSVSALGQFGIKADPEWTQKGDTKV